MDELAITDINTHMTERPPHGVEKHQVAGAQVFRVDGHRGLCLLGGSSRDALVRALRARCDTLGARVTIDGVTGVAKDLADDGALLVERDDGTLTAVRAGEITE